MARAIMLAVVALALALGVWYWYGAPGVQPAQIANLASVHCVEQRDGHIEIRGESGGQTGYCRLPDDRLCEEWALMRDGSCVPPMGTATTSESDVSCHDSVKYVVVTRDRAGSGEVGNDILVKHKTGAQDAVACAYVVAPGDIELAAPGPTYFLGLTGDYLLLDHGTAPPPRGLSVYDLTVGKEIYSDQYNKPVEVGEGTFTYWQPITTAPTTENCPDLSTWRANGLDAGIERHVTLDLATLQFTDLGDMRCAVRQ